MCYYFYMDSNLPQDSKGNPAQANASLDPMQNQAGKSASQPQQDTPISDLDQPIAPPLSKDEKEAIGSFYKEGEPGTIEKKEFKIPKEVGEVVKEVKKEEEIKLPQPIKDEYGQILMEAASPSKPKIVLPLDDQGIKTGVKQKVSDSIRWLAALCIRLIKMFPGRAIYKSQASSTK